MFTQRPPQVFTVPLSGHLHWPLTHLSLPVHFTPQAPQLSSSDCWFTHAPPQSVAPAPHVATQFPALHTETMGVPPSGTPPSGGGGAMHLMPQEPQLSGSLMVSTHTPEQFTVPGGHAHTPFEQSWPDEQTLPQAPQLLRSTFVSVQPPAQAV